MTKSTRSLQIGIGIVLVAAAIFFLLRGNVKEQPKEQNASYLSEPFDLAMVTFPGYAPFYLAKAKGFFDPLNVRLRRIEDIATIRAGIATGELEAYLATTDIAIDSQTRPMGVAFWAVDESSGGDGVIVTGDIENLADLKGKKVAGEMGFPPYFILLYLLNKAGLNIQDVNFQDMTTQEAATAFISNQVDVAAIYEPYLTSARQNRAGSQIMVSSAQTPGLIVDSIFAREDLLGEKDLLHHIIAGWQKALAYIESHPEESFRIMAQAYGLSVADFQDQASAVKWLDIQENQALFGTKEEPGALYQNFNDIRDTLRNNRSSVFLSQADEHFTRTFVHEVANGR